MLLLHPTRAPREFIVTVVLASSRRAHTGRIRAANIEQAAARIDFALARAGHAALTVTIECVDGEDATLSPLAAAAPSQRPRPAAPAPMMQISLVDAARALYGARQ